MTNPYALFTDLAQLRASGLEPEPLAQAVLARIAAHLQEFPEGTLPTSPELAELVPQAALLSDTSLLAMTSLLFAEGQVERDELCLLARELLRRPAAARQAFLEQLVGHHARREDGHLAYGDAGLGTLFAEVLPELPAEQLGWLVEWGHTHGFPLDFGYLLEPLLLGPGPLDGKERALDLALAALRADPSLGFLSRCLAAPGLDPVLRRRLEAALSA